jgi:hypothetical protein
VRDAAQGAMAIVDNDNRQHGVGCSNLIKRRARPTRPHGQYCGETAVGYCPLKSVSSWIRFPVCYAVSSGWVVR